MLSAETVEFVTNLVWTMASPPDAKRKRSVASILDTSDSSDDSSFHTPCASSDDELPSMSDVLCSPE